MSNLAQIVQLIATAVNSKLTLKVSQQIAAISLSTQRGPGWIDRTTAGRALSQRKIEASQSRVKDATQEHALARTQAQQSAAQWLQESLAPTGQDLAALAETAEKYRQKMEVAAKELDRVTKEHFAIKAAEVSQNQTRRLAKADHAVDQSTQERDSLQNKYSSVRAAITEEATNPTGLDPALLQQMEAASQQYEMQLNAANVSLKKVISEQDQLRQSIDAQVKLIDGFSPNDLTALDRSAKRVESATDTRNQAQAAFDRSKTELTNEILNPTGKTDVQLLEMAKAIDQYKQNLDDASHVLAAVTAAEQAVQTSLLQQAKNQQIANQRHPQTPIQATLRKASVLSRRMLGTRGRAGLKSVQGPLSSVATLFQPNAAKAARSKARSQYARALRANKAAQANLQSANAGHQTAKSGYASTVAAYRQNPNPQTGAAVKAARVAMGASRATAVAASGTAATASQAVASSGSALSAASKISALSTSLSRLSVVAGPVGIVMAAAGLAITKSLSFINRQAAEGMKEIERFRQQRATYSGQVQNAINRYDVQSRQLEQRSSASTGNSARAVTESTMALREANQVRNEQWEQIWNRLLSTALDAATVMSRILNVIDVFTPSVLLSLDTANATMRALGFPIKAIEFNTRPSVGDGNIDVLIAGLKANQGINKQPSRVPPIK